MDNVSKILGKLSQYPNALAKMVAEYQKAFGELPYSPAGDSPDRTLTETVKRCKGEFNTGVSAITEAVANMDNAIDVALSGTVPTWLPGEERKLFALGVITLDDYVECPHCNGHGTCLGEEDDYEQPCPMCNRARKVLSDEARERVQEYLRR